MRLFSVCRRLSVLLFLLFIGGHSCDDQKNTLETDRNDIQINVNENAFFRLLFTNTSLTEDVLHVTLGCDTGDHCGTISPSSLPPLLNFTTTSNVLMFNITALSPGHDVIVAKALLNSSSHLDDDNAFVRVRVGRSQSWITASQVVGWLYFFIWSASFWPQNITNYRRKSVVGFSLDFAALNVTGFCFYTVFNAGLYFSPTVRALYEQRFPRSEIPVELNDVIYAIHAAFTTTITLIQCYIYERGDQRMSLLGKAFTGITWSAAAVQLVLCLLNVMNWLTFMYYFSYVKLVVTSVKYAPQAYFNYKRKSTRGWSLAMIYMDITGGVNGLLQMIFIAYNYDDWKTIFGNFAKFGLSVASITYDIIFFLQEYLFYPKSASRLNPCDEERHFPRKQSRKSVVSVVSLRSESFASTDHKNQRSKSVVSVISAKSVENVKNIFH